MGQPCLDTLAAYLRDTDVILSTSILRFSTSFTRPLSGPCVTFSRPIKYKHFGVRSKSRFTPWKEMCFKKVDRHVKATTLPDGGELPYVTNFFYHWVSLIYHLSGTLESKRGRC